MQAARVRTWRWFEGLRFAEGCWRTEDQEWSVPPGSGRPWASELAQSEPCWDRWGRTDACWSCLCYWGLHP